METKAKNLNCLLSYWGLNRFSLGQISELLRLTKESYCNVKLKCPDTGQHTVLLFFSILWKLQEFSQSSLIRRILIKKLCYVKVLDTKRLHLDSQITGYDVIVDSNLHSASYRFYSSYDVPFLPWRILTFTFFPWDVLVWLPGP